MLRSNLLEERSNSSTNGQPEHSQHDAGNWVLGRHSGDRPRTRPKCGARHGFRDPLGDNCLADGPTHRLEAPRDVIQSIAVELAFQSKFDYELPHRISLEAMDDRSSNRPIDSSSFQILQAGVSPER